jgi:hypothetical protein
VDWSTFPSFGLEESTELFRIHQEHLHPAWFNNDGGWRFDPPPTHRTKFGSCYLGLEPLSSYVEVFGRIGTVPEGEVSKRALSSLTSLGTFAIADLTDRTVLGLYKVTAAHSTGTDYEPAQKLAADLYDAGFDGIRYRVSHDPAMKLEAIAVFGEPGETPGRLSSPKTSPIPRSLIVEGEAFSIFVNPSALLP